MYWEVRLGKHNIRQKELNERTHQVAKLFHIKNYRAYDNDLAILKLEEKVEPNEYIRPICLPSNEHLDFSNSECELLLNLDLENFDCFLYHFS